MVELDIEPGDEWNTAQNQLKIRFNDELEVQKHYEKIVTLWRRAQEYRNRVDDLLEAEKAGEDLQKYRKASASAGEDLRDVIGEGSFDLSKLSDMRDSIFRSINRTGASALATSPDYGDEEILDIVADGYQWVAEEMYIPAIQTAQYEEDRLYREQTLLERVWMAEEERVSQNRLENALETIQSNPGMHSRDSANWAEELLTHLRTL